MVSLIQWVPGTDIPGERLSDRATAVPLLFRVYHGVGGDSGWRSWGIGREWLGIRELGV
jgi:hypothetical protein